MLEKLAITRMAQGLAAHAGQRMGVISQNVANADTPGYKARDLPSFAKTYGDQFVQGQRATRPGHLDGVTRLSEAVVRPQASSPNGNSVSLEDQMVKAAEIRQQHDMALSIYRATSDVLKLALGRGR